MYGERHICRKGSEARGLEDPEYLYELKFDGFRSLVYLDPEGGGTEIRSKRGNSLQAKFPELAGLHTLVKKRCVLDGELVILTKGGCPDFEALQVRSHMTARFSIDASAKRAPATMIVFDILYEGEDRLTALPLWQRKQRLAAVLEGDGGGSLQESVYAEGTVPPFGRLRSSMGWRG